MAVLMAARGRFPESFDAVVGRVSETSGVARPAETVLVCRGNQLPDIDLAKFAAVLTEADTVSAKATRMGSYKSLDHLAEGDIVLVDGASGLTRTLARRGSKDTALFLTSRCDNNCLMCSQPPKHDEGMLETCLQVVKLLREAPPAHLGITGGEPTLLGSQLVELLSRLKTDLPDTVLTVLTNGRTFADPGLVASIAAVGHPRLRFSVPIHGDVADVHDYIAQAQGAFHETLAGLYNLAAAGIEVELRVVLHAQSVPRLNQVAEFIWRKLPFVAQVAFMGLEQMGYVKKNWDLLWIDPADYSDRLGDAVEYLFRRGMNASLYNLPLCVIPRSIWSFSCQSISEHKQTYYPECGNCVVQKHCAGFFSSGAVRSRSICPITEPALRAAATTLAGVSH